MGNSPEQASPTKVKASKSWLKSVMARKSTLSVLLEWLCFVPLVVAAFVARNWPKPIDVGIGPEPLINNPYHKKALISAGYTAETFVLGTYFITDDFDLNLAKKRIDVLPAVWRPLVLMFRAMFRYRALMIYFNGGPLFYTNTLAWLEPLLLRIADVKVLALPYGVDVQDMIRTDNLYFRHAMDQDYPQQFRQFPEVKRRIDRWCRQADWVFAGVEWVDYLHTWNSLMLGHFSIDPDVWAETPKVPMPDEFTKDYPLQVFHAPNHLAVKGTAHLIEAINRLKAEGLPIELVMKRKVPNHEIRDAMASCHLVADQFVLGWYAMFALEAMAMGRPVLCYLRPDLLRLYEEAGLLESGEMPLINTDLLNIEGVLRWAVAHPQELRRYAEAGPGFVQRHHSTLAIGKVFAQVLSGLGVTPARASQESHKSHPDEALTQSQATQTVG